MPRLLILEKDFDTYFELVRQRSLSGLEILRPDTHHNLEELAARADIILARPALAVPLLPFAPNLKWLQSTYAGIEQLCDENLRRDYILTGVKEVFGPLMSEYVFTYILARERHLLETRENQLNKLWSRIDYRSLSGLTLGIAGLGSIGLHIAETASAFNMNVLGIKRTREYVEGVSRIYTTNEKEQFLPEIDYLVVTLPDTDQTRNFLCLKDFALMKNDAVLISVGRGTTVHQDDLITALEKKLIAGAVLDVFEQEPLPKSSPLWSMSNVFITPHNSAYSFPEQVVDIFQQNYERYRANKELRYVIDFQNGY